MGQKDEHTSSLNIKIGTSNLVGPGSYKVSQSSIFQSDKLSSPKWSFPENKRPDLAQKVFTKNETYSLYK